jgi:hypothetical protein
MVKRKDDSCSATVKFCRSPPQIIEDSVGVESLTTVKVCTSLL